VNLHRKFFLRENKFYEQRKNANSGIEASPRPFWRHLGPSFTKFGSGERAGDEGAVVTGEPGFADRLGEI
jgi:hypothetical protein